MALSNSIVTSVLGQNEDVTSSDNCILSNVSTDFTNTLGTVTTTRSVELSDAGIVRFVEHVDLGTDESVLQLAGMDGRSPTV